MAKRMHHQGLLHPGDGPAYPIELQHGSFAAPKTYIQGPHGHLLKPKLPPGSESLETIKQFLLTGGIRQTTTGVNCPYFCMERSMARSALGSTTRHGKKRSPIPLIAILVVFGKQDWLESLSCRGSPHGKDYVAGRNIPSSGRLWLSPLEITSGGSRTDSFCISID